MQQIAWLVDLSLLLSFGLSKVLVVVSGEP